MHIRRHLRDTLTSTLEGIDGVRVLKTHRVSIATALADQGQAAIIVYHVADLPMQRVNAAIQGPRPGYRGFAFGVAAIVCDEDAEDGRLDEISEEIERRVFAPDSPLRSIATRDIVDGGGEISMIAVSDRAVALNTVFEFHVPMLEGVPESIAF